MTDSASCSYILRSAFFVASDPLYAGMSNSEVARNLGWFPLLLNKRMNTGEFTVEEWERIGSAVGVEARIAFCFSDGKEI